MITMQDLIYLRYIKKCRPGKTDFDSDRQNAPSTWAIVFFSFGL